MPSNFKGLRASLKRGSKLQADSIAAKIQTKVMTIILEEVARTTPVDTGRLAGNYVVVVGRGGTPFDPNKFNKTREPSASNLAIVASLDGKGSVAIANKTPYSEIVNRGQFHAKYFERALLAAENRIAAAGIRAKPS